MEKNKIKNEKETQGQEWVEYVFSVAVPMPLFVAEETKQRIGQEIKKLLEEFIAEPRVIEFESSRGMARLWRTWKETQEQEWVEYVFSVAVPMPLFVAEETKQRIGQEIKKLLEEFIAEPRVIEFKSS